MKNTPFYKEFYLWKGGAMLSLFVVMPFTFILLPLFLRGLFPRACAQPALKAMDPKRITFPLIVGLGLTALFAGGKTSLLIPFYWLVVFVPPHIFKGYLRWLKCPLKQKINQRFVGAVTLFITGFGLLFSLVLGQALIDIVTALSKVESETQGLLLSVLKNPRLVFMGLAQFYLLSMVYGMSSLFLQISKAGEVRSVMNLKGLSFPKLGLVLFMLPAAAGALIKGTLFFEGVTMSLGLFLMLPAFAMGMAAADAVLPKVKNQVRSKWLGPLFAIMFLIQQVFFCIVLVGLVKNMIVAEKK